MCEQDAAWKDRTQARVNWLFDHLPFNKTSLMLKLRQKFHVSGYDWLGLITGRVPADCMTLLHVASVSYVTLLKLSD